VYSGLSTLKLSNELLNLYSVLITELKAVFSVKGVFRVQLALSFDFRLEC